MSMPTCPHALHFFSPAGMDKYFKEVSKPVQDRFAAIPLLREALISRMVGAGQNMESSLCETAPPSHGAMMIGKLAFEFSLRAAANVFVGLTLLMAGCSLTLSSHWR